MILVTLHVVCCIFLMIIISNTESMLGRGRVSVYTASTEALAQNVPGLAGYYLDFRCLWPTINRHHNIISSISSHSVDHFS